MDHIYSVDDAMAFGEHAMGEHGFFIVRGLISAQMAKSGVKAIRERIKEALVAHGVCEGKAMEDGKSDGGGWDRGE